MFKFQIGDLVRFHANTEHYGIIEKYAKTADYYFVKWLHTDVEIRFPYHRSALVKLES
jgi:hypothetical protein